MKHIFILCDGTPPAAGLFRKCLSASDYFIAADGGINIARNLGHSPDVVIGDLDNFEPDEGDDFKVIYDPDQETNDLEKALELALKKEGTHIQIAGATGKRLDHTLKNLSVLKRFQTSFQEIVIKDNFGDTFLIPRQYSTHLPVGTQISLFPLSGKVTGITTQGLKYALSNEALENGVRDGSSNEVVKNPLEISYEQGDLLVFINNEDL